MLLCFAAEETSCPLTTSSFLACIPFLHANNMGKIMENTMYDTLLKPLKARWIKQWKGIALMPSLHTPWREQNASLGGLTFSF